MISQAVSPSSHSVTRPRMMTGWNGLSAGARDSATRGSRRRLRALRERGPVKKISWSSWVATKSGVVWGEPSGRTVARWPSEVPSRTRRTSGSSMFFSCRGSGAGGLAVMSPQPADVVRHGALDVVLGPEASVLAQPGGVEVVVRGPVGIATLREGDVRARNRGVDRGDDLAVPHQPSGRDVVGAVAQPLREHAQRDG